MLKLILRMLGEILIGVSLAGIVLAISVPMMMRSGMIASGDLTGSVIIAGALVLAAVGMLFRPGSALNRYGK